jgi:hypothetical protein
MMSEGPPTPPASRPTSPVLEDIEVDESVDESDIELELEQASGPSPTNAPTQGSSADIVVDAQPRFSGPKGSHLHHPSPTPSSVVMAEPSTTAQPAEPEAPTRPARYLDDEQSHVHKSGSGSVTLRDFEVQGTLGILLHGLITRVLVLN